MSDSKGIRVSRTADVTLISSIVGGNQRVGNMNIAPKDVQLKPVASKTLQDFGRMIWHLFNSVLLINQQDNVIGAHHELETGLRTRDPRMRPQIYRAY